MLDLPTCLVILISLQITILDSHFIDHFNMNGRVLHIIFVRLEKGHIRRVDRYDVVGRIHYKTEILLYYLLFQKPRAAQLVQILLHF